MGPHRRARRSTCRPGGSRRLVAALLTALVVGCVDLRSPEATRPDDGLLDRPDLQELVDRQVARDPGFLIERLSDPDPAVRARATFALASVGVPGGVAPIAERLRDSSAVVRRDAAFALGRLGGGAETDAALIRALEEEVVHEVRREVITSIGLVGGGGAISALASGSGARHAPERLLALSRALVRGAGDAAVVERLRDGLTHADPDVRAAAAYGIGRTGDASVWAPVAGDVLAALDALEPDDRALLELVEGVGRAGLDEGASPVTALLASSEDWRIRVEAARALAAVGGEEAADALLAGLDDTSVHVGVASAEALADRGANEATSAAVEAWIEEHPDRWRVAAPLFTVLADAEGERLFALFDATYPEGVHAGRRVAGVEALERVGGERVVSRLRPAIVNAEGVVASVATSVLVRLARQAVARGEEAAPFRAALAAGLRSPHADVVESAARALLDQATGGSGDGEPIVVAWREVADEAAAVDRERLEALLRPLARADDAASLALLREQLGHPLGSVRGTAAFALSQRLGRAVPPAERGRRPEAAVEGPDETSPEAEGSSPALPAGIGEAVDWPLLRELGPRPRLIVEVEGGRIVLELDADEAPMTVSTVATLAGAGLYDGVPFHRVVPNFVVQGGDIAEGDGSGRAGFRIPTELTTRAFDGGTVGMASLGRDTEAAQYFVTHSAQPHLDGEYTAFGTVVEGREVLDAVSRWDPAVSVRVEPGR